MKLFVFFGLPGAGKSFVGTVAEKYFGYHVYDGDNDLTEELHIAFQNQAIVTDDMRDAFFKKLIQSVKELQQKFPKLIITQTFIKEKYREQFLHAFPDAQFVLVETDTKIREKRLAERTYYPLEETYARKMVQLFDDPRLTQGSIQNTSDGEERIKEQLKKILV